MSEVKTKVCTKCGIEKELSEFYKTQRGCCKKCKSKVCLIYYKKNKEKIDKRNAEYKAKNKDRYKDLKRNWALKNIDIVKMSQKKYIYKLKDAYVKRLLLINSSGLKKEDIPTELIEVKRLQLQITRELRG